MSQKLNSFDEWIEDLSSYLTSIADGKKIRKLYSSEYPAKDLEDSIKNYNNPEEAVASHELVSAFKRSQLMRRKKPSDYYKDYKEFSDSYKESYLNLIKKSIDAEKKGLI